MVLREKDEVEFQAIEGRNNTAVHIKMLGFVSILNESEAKKGVAVAPPEKQESATFRPAWMSSSIATPLPTSTTVPSSTSHNRDDQEDESERSLSKRKMLDWIKTIDEGDPETLLLHMTVLEQVLNSDEMPFTVIQPLVHILTREEVLESEKTDKIYNMVLESKFLRNPRNLRSYILKLSSAKTPTQDDIKNFGRVLVLLQELMDRFRNYRDLPLDTLDSSRFSMFPSSITAHIDKLSKMASNIRSQTTQSMINTNWAPQEEDFREVPIFPTTEEILGIKSGELNPNLRESIFTILFPFSKFW